MSNSRIQPQALNAKLSWEIIGLDLAKNDVSFVGITLEGEIIRIERLTYEQLLEFSKKQIQPSLLWNRAASRTT